MRNATTGAGDSGISGACFAEPLAHRPQDAIQYGPAWLKEIPGRNPAGVLGSACGQGGLPGQVSPAAAGLGGQGAELPLQVPHARRQCRAARPWADQHALAGHPCCPQRPPGSAAKFGERLADQADFLVTERRDFHLGGANRRITRLCRDGGRKGAGDCLAGVIAGHGHQAQPGFRGCLGQLVKQPRISLLRGFGAVQHHQPDRRHRGSGKDAPQRRLQELGRRQRRAGRQIAQAQRDHRSSSAADLLDRSQHSR
jgi:hypothetical protein